MTTANEYRIVKIPKGGGRFRTIYMPNRQLKERQRALIGELEEIALKVCPPGVVHGFWPCRSCVTNAACHIGFEYTVCMDLKNFFDSCTKMVYTQATGEFPQWVYVCFVGAAPAPTVARQGLPTSPAVSNICAAPMDKMILESCPNMRYSRYADDMTLSCNDLATAKRAIKVVTACAKDNGFQINERKTRIQWAGAGRRIITGVAVDDTQVYPTRKTRRRLRAAKHKATLTGKYHYIHRAAGLAEWAKCKTPGIGKKARKEVDENPRDAVVIAAAAAKFR